MRFPRAWDMTSGNTIWGCTGVVHRCVFSSVRALGTPEDWLESHRDSITDAQMGATADGDVTLSYRDPQWTHILRWHGAHMFRLSYGATRPPDDFYLVPHTMKWAP